MFSLRSLCFLLGGTLGTLQYKFFTCFMLASITKELTLQGSCPADQLAFARTKLARRGAKLQQRQDLATPQVATAIEGLFHIYGRLFKETLGIVNVKLDEMWESIQTRVTKRFLPLPRRADPDSTALSLAHSVSGLSRLSGFPTRRATSWRPQNNLVAHLLQEGTSVKEKR